MEDNFFLAGIRTFDLRQLYKDSRSELKKRGQLMFLNEYRKESLTPKYHVLDAKQISQGKSRGIILSDRNNESAGSYDPPKKWHAHNSILVDFLNEDWSFLFAGRNNEKRNFYVYYHLNPNTEKFSITKSTNGNRTLLRFGGTPFYIGKGSGKRFMDIGKRSTSHVNIINTYQNSGYDKSDVCKILIDGLTEVEALELESKLITYFGCYNECLAIQKKHFNGTGGGLLINSDVGKRPDWVKDTLDIQFGILKIID
jgi:hypothetical protein